MVLSVASHCIEFHIHSSFPPLFFLLKALYLSFDFLYLILLRLALRYSTTTPGPICLFFPLSFPNVFSFSFLCFAAPDLASVGAAVRRGSDSPLFVT